MNEQTQTQVLQLEPRDCENCGGNDLEQLWQLSHDARTRVGIYRFNRTDVICRNCGFVFSSPVYRETDLAEYYMNSFAAFEGAEPDYSVEKCMAFLTKVSQKGEVFVEIGSNRPTVFHERVERLYERIRLIEPNNSVKRDDSALSDADAGIADVVAHYFVLEHVPRVRKFLRRCHDVRKIGGIMICEVPDLVSIPKIRAGSRFMNIPTIFPSERFVRLLQVRGLI